MKRGLLVAIVAMGLLALSVSVGLRSLTAQPPAGGAKLEVLKRPDLMVKWASFDLKEGSGGFETCTMKACIRNAGNGTSPLTKLAVYWVGDWALAPPADAGLWATCDVPAIPAGQETVVTVHEAAGFAKTVFLVYIDCPVAGKSLGRASEHRANPAGTTRAVAEVNNVLVCQVDPAALPRTIYNPGACDGGY